MKNVKSSQASVSINSCIDLRKKQFFPMSIVNKSMERYIRSDKLVSKN